MRINQSPWIQNTKTHLCYRDGTKARFVKASENTWIQARKALNPPHPFHILPKPIVISHPSFFPRCQIFPKVALGACAMTRDRTFSSRSYFGLFLLIFQNPLKARLARNATNPRLSLGVRYLPFTTPTSCMSFGKQAWKVIINIMMMSTNINIITIIMNIIIIMEGWQWDAFVSWPLPE